MKTFMMPLLLTLALTLSSSMFAGKPPAEKALRHVVAFQFNESATPAQVKEVVDAFRALKTKIPEIVAFETGTNVSPEGLDKGFTHGFILTFASAEDRDTYLVHPDHKAFGELVGSVLKDVFVIDFWAE